MNSRQRFADMMSQVLASNRFYQGRYAPLGFDATRVPTLDDLPSLPLLTKADLAEDQRAHPPYGRNLTFPRDRYVRVHQTSGTTGRPLQWPDTAEGWDWWLRCWGKVYETAGVTAADRVFVAFSFAPFIGFWTGFEAAQRLGALTIPGGGLSSAQRLGALEEHAATVLVCTPTYALRLLEVARQTGRDLAASPLRVTIHAGEPGASVPAVKARLEEGFGATCVDHVGATEVGAWGYGRPGSTDVEVNADEFIAEVIDPMTGDPVAAGADGTRRGELVLTNLGRTGSPVIRYRTGDLVVRRDGEPPVLEGGVLGRVDDMVIVRGVNVFPSAIENLVREFPEVVEFEVHVTPDRSMSRLVVKVEVEGDAETTCRALARRIHDGLHLTAEIRAVPSGELPRYELKARRFHVHPED